MSVPKLPAGALYKNKRVKIVPPQRPVTATSYEIYGRRVVLSGREGDWRVTVDQVAYGASFPTVAAAWAAGVREADRLQRSGRGAELHP
jgi:hypothetical protein